MTKEQAIQEITKNPWRFSSVKEFHNDKDFVLTSLRIDGYNLRFLKDEFKNDFEVVMTAVKQNGKALKFASEALKNNKEIAVEALKSDPCSMTFIGEDLKLRDKEFFNRWMHSRLECSEIEEIEKIDKNDAIINKELPETESEIIDIINESLQLAKEYNVTQTDMLLILQILELRKQNK